MDEIEVVGESLEGVSFDLNRLGENVLEMPVSFCLGLLSTGELLQVHRGLTLYGFLPEGTTPPAGRTALLKALATLLSAEGYFGRALAQCDEHARVLLDLIVAQGGTSGDLVAIRDALGAHYAGNESLHYAPPARTLLRLGLAYPVEGLARPYYLLPEGLVAAMS